MLVNSANSDNMNLSESDVLIFCRGANNVGKNSSTKAYNISWTSSNLIITLILFN
jgi:hypothetical protein